MPKPLIILDRDGVINYDSDAFVKSADEWLPLPGSIEAMARLSQAGYSLAVATNQSGVGRGYFGLAELDAMHQKMLDLLAQAGGEVEAICFCPHLPDATCDCRKPLPGLIHQIAHKLNRDVTGAYMVGDSIRDLEAGVAAGCRPVLVLTGKGAKSASRLPMATLGLVDIFPDLAAFADHLLSEQG